MPAGHKDMVRETQFFIFPLHMTGGVLECWNEAGEFRIFLCFFGKKRMDPVPITAWQFVDGGHTTPLRLLKGSQCAGLVGVYSVDFDLLETPGDGSVELAIHSIDGEWAICG